MLRRDEWLLLFIGMPGGPYPTDQIRVMKGMFLISQEGPNELRDLYKFEPYHYGPFNTAVYADLDLLELDGLIRSDVVVESNRRIYSLTEKGRHTATAIEQQVHASVLQRVRDIKCHVTSFNFLDLLKDVYERYPTYAVRSVARR